MYVYPPLVFVRSHRLLRSFTHAIGFLCIPVGHLQQQEQQDSLFSADLKRKLDEMYQVVVEDRTEKKSYTDASMAFCNDLLGGLSIRYQENSLNQEDVDGAPLEALPWTQTLTDGTAVNLSEPARTQAALDWLKANMTPGFKVANQPIALKDVKGKQFQPLRAAKKEANGKTDGVVGIQAEIQACENTTEWYFTYSMGLVEIKTDRRRLKKPQMFFQLVALSRESRWGQAVVLLGTDCNKSWFLMWFQEHNKICLQQYLHGRTCLQNFEMLLANIHQRQEDLEESCRKLGRVSSLAIQEEQGEHDLSGFPVNGGSGTDQDKVDQALENEAFLHRVANDLAELYGERPALPEWALAKNKIPSYYA